MGLDSGIRFKIHFNETWYFVHLFVSFRRIEGSETLWWRGESYKMFFSSLLTLHSRHSALPRCPESILATGSASHFDSFLYLRIRKTFMRRTHQHSFTRFPQSPLVSSRFKEHLSIAVPPLDSDHFHERSYIFPESYRMRDPFRRTYFLTQVLSMHSVS